MYEFLSGPMLILSLAVFFIGMTARAIWYIKGLNWKLDRVAYRAHMNTGVKGALRSIFYWLLPFGTRSWRTQPVMTILFFGFHLGAILVPLFLYAHTVLLKQAFGMVWPLTLPPVLADILSWAAIACALFIVLRRIALPEVRYMTTGNDYFIILIAALPFITGMIARYQLGDYDLFLNLHMAAGELVLILAPFTKLSHIILFFMSRAQLGMDYGIKRGGMKGSHVAW